MALVDQALFCEPCGIKVAQRIEVYQLGKPIRDWRVEHPAIPATAPDEWHPHGVSGFTHQHPEQHPHWLIETVELLNGTTEERRQPC